jgi:hypothetical protein
MGIDAVAILHIARLPEIGDVLVTHRGDASLVHTLVGFDSCEPDEHALALRNLVGPDLDAHDDPRGILFYPDVGGPPRADNYADMVREMEHGGVWAPIVAADYLPARYARAGTHDGLIGEMIAIVGRKAGFELAILAEMRRVDVATGKPGNRQAAAAYQASIDDIKSIMGAEFAARFDKSVTGKIDAWLRAAAGR